MIKNYLTIDVEDYFQVSAFEECVTHKGWESYPSRVENNTERILSLLEKHQVKGTFFILGWTAEKFPQLVKKISSKGHEIACHSYYHRLVYNLTPEEFRQDTRKAKDVLEQITGRPVLGYRAPSYSITKNSLWALHILRELGFYYSSSVFPVYHDRYGMPHAPRYPFLWNLDSTTPQIVDMKGETVREILDYFATEALSGTVNKTSSLLLEIPISTSLVFKKNLPVSGGGYFRLFPYWFTRRALQQINNKEKKPFIFYLHPWEVDPEQPRMANATPRSRFRHYLNLHRTYERLEKLLHDFSFTSIDIQRNGLESTSKTKSCNDVSPAAANTMCASRQAPPEIPPFQLFRRR